MERWRGWWCWLAKLVRGVTCAVDGKETLALSEGGCSHMRAHNSTAATCPHLTSGMRALRGLCAVLLQMLPGTNTGALLKLTPADKERYKAYVALPCHSCPCPCSCSCHP